MAMVGALASGNVPVKYSVLPGGFQGTDRTVEKMRELTSGIYGTRSPKIRALAINILRGAGAPEKNYRAEMVAIHNWVRDNIRYTRDVHGQETLCPPEEIAFNTRAGDCDDKSMLDAALLGAIGIPTRFKVLGQTPGMYSHVYLQARIGSQWVSLDPIMRDKAAGWEAPQSMRVIEKVYPENTPEGVTMSRLNGLGYVGDPRIVSHLEDDPAPQPRARTPYVSMNSFLDNDAPIEQLSNDAPAFAQNANVQPRTAPMAKRMGARLVDMRGGAQQTPGNRAAPWDSTERRGCASGRQIQAQQNRSAAAADAALRAGQDEDAQAAAEQAAMTPGAGMNDVWTPDELAGVGSMVMARDEAPKANMQRPALVMQPEGVDEAFGRNALVMRADRGDRIDYRGLWAMNEKPPIRRIGLGGFAPGTVGTGRRSFMPGMGYLSGRNLSGPGVGDDPTPKAIQADINPVANKKPIQYGLIAVAALAAYLLLRKKK